MKNKSLHEIFKELQSIKMKLAKDKRYLENLKEEIEIYKNKKW